jgi:membrane protein
MKRLIKKIFEPAGFVVRVIGKSTDDQVGAYAAQSAFFILMSLFPFLILLLQLMKYAPVSQEDLLFTVDSIFPDYLLPALHDILQELYSSSFGYIGLSSVTTLWAASKSMHALSTGLDRIAGITELKNWFIIRLWALLYTICLAILLMFAAAMTVFWRNVRTFLLHMRPKGVPLYLYSTAMRTVYVIFLMTLGISLMYRWFPHKKLKFSEQLPGAFVATIGWMAFSLFVTVYLGAFHAFSMYGSLTTLAIVMFWLYFSMYIIMIGAEVNEVMRQDRENSSS